MAFRLLALVSLVALATAWQNCDRSEIKTVNTNGNQYTLINELDLKEKESVVVFSVKACSNARMRLTTESTQGSKGYNLNIDVEDEGVVNTFINYRYGVKNQWSRAMDLPVGPKLDCDEFRDFWISWNYNTRRIAIGEGKDPNAGEYGYRIVDDEKHHQVKYVHVRSGDGNPAVWKFYRQCQSNVPVQSCGTEDTACNSCKGQLLNTVSNSPRSYKIIEEIDMQGKKPTVVFCAKSCNGVRMRFLETKSIGGQGYNVNIDMHDDDEDPEDVFRTVINYRTGLMGNKYITTRELPLAKKMSCEEFTCYWTTWDYESGKLSLGEGRDPTRGEYLYAMMTGDRKLNIRYASVVAPASGVGTWKIYDQCELDTVEPACAATTDCEDNFQCNDGECVECPEGTKLNDGECKQACVGDEECPSGSACTTDSVCIACPAGTMPKFGVCEESCTSSSDCEEDNNACVDGFCDPCLVHEIVEDNACVSVCDVKKEEGTCDSPSERWFYKAGSSICVSFDACDDVIGNNFATKEECSEACTPKTLPEECKLPADAGECEDYQRRYFYDTAKQGCSKFEYNGCQGNANNFESKDACRLHCAKFD